MMKTHRVQHLTGLSIIFAGVLLLASASFALAMEKKTVDTACMQDAVAAREAAISESWADFSEVITEALAARSEALDEAWGLADAKSQKAAVKTAWSDWKEISKAAHTAMKEDRKAAWDTFKTTAKTTCKVSVPKEESLGKDTSGSIAL